MHTGEISFCDHTAYNIKSDDIKEAILKRIELKYGLKIIHKHHDKFDINSIPRLKDNPHLICVRSNGNPYFMYLMRYNSNQYCVFIDKKVQQGYHLPRMIIVHACFEDSLFEDTIIDGEMVKPCHVNPGNKWYFICNDLIVYKGQHLVNANLPKRINMLYDMLGNEYEPQAHDAFIICIKTFFKYGEWKNIMQTYIPSLPYTCRGIYLKPLFLKFKDTLINFNEQLITKVERVKYKEIKPFLISKDELTEATASRSASSCSSVPSCGTSVCEDDIGESNVKAISTVVQAASMDATMPCLIASSTSPVTFKVKKTNTPDIYEIYDNMVMVGFAGIPNLRVSKMMRNLTYEMSLVDKLLWKFTWSQKWNKWIPIDP